MPWWEERITGAFMAYWLYQHLGNLSPPELAEETLFRQVQEDDDAGPRLREFARRCDRESAASRWAYYRDFGRSRLLVIDSRAARVLVDGRRDMIDEEEWDWIAEHARGSFDHLIVATTLPVFLQHGIHHLEAWNEAVCDGRWGSFAARIGERVRRAVDLEHWAAFQRSFEQLVDLLRDGRAMAWGRGTRDDHDPERRRPHHVRRRDRPRRGRGPSRVSQVVCSPFRNPLKPRERRVVQGDGLACRSGRLRVAGQEVRSSSADGFVALRRAPDVREHDRRVVARRTTGGRLALPQFCRRRQSAPSPFP